MVNLYLDTEFNGIGRELISMALVPEDLDAPEFYEVLPLPTYVDSWVRENVLPRLGKAPIFPREFSGKLSEYLFRDYMDVHIYADWPEDFVHFCRVRTDIEAAAGFGKVLPLTLHLINTTDTQPLIPHNALSDARALRDWCVKQVRA